MMRIRREDGRVMGRAKERSRYCGVGSGMPPDSALGAVRGSLCLRLLIFSGGNETEACEVWTTVLDELVVVTVCEDESWRSLCLSDEAVMMVP